MAGRMLQRIRFGPNFVHRFLLALAAFALLLIGPYVQWATVAAANNQRPTMTEAAAGRGVYLFPTFNDVVFDPSNLLLLLIAAVVFIPRSQLSVIDYFVKKTAILTALLSLMDAAFYWGEPDFFPAMVTNFFFNLIGSIILVFVFVVILSIASDKDDNSDISVRSVSSFMIGSASLVIAFVAFMFISLFLETMSNKVAVSGELPLSFDWTSIKKDDPYYKDSPEEDQKQFQGFLSTPNLEGSVELDAYKLRLTIPPSTKSTEGKLIFRQVFFCGHSVTSQSTLEVPLFGGRPVDVETDEKMAHAMFHSSGNLNLEFTDRYGTETVRKVRGGLSVSRLLGRNGISMSFEDAFSAVVSPTYVSQSTQQNPVASNRSVVVRSREKVLRTFRLRAQPEFPGTVGQCTQGSDGGLPDAIELRFVGPDSGQATKIEVSAPGGVLKAKLRSPVPGEEPNLGVARFVSIGFERNAVLNIDNADTSIKGASFWMRGHLRPELTAASGVMIKGEADVIWSDERFLSKSRWFTLEKEWQISLLGLSLTIIGFLGRFMIGQFWRARHRILDNAA